MQAFWGVFGLFFQGPPPPCSSLAHLRALSLPHPSRARARALSPSRFRPLPLSPPRALSRLDMHSDLSEVLRTNVLTGAQVKSYMVMLLRGVAYCHDMNIMHRVSE